MYHFIANDDFKGCVWANTLLWGLALASTGCMPAEDESGRAVSCAAADHQAVAQECESVGGRLEAWDNPTLMACADTKLAAGPCRLQQNSCRRTCVMPEAIDVCGHDVSAFEVAYLMHGLTFFASQQAEEGTSVYTFLTDVIIGMLVYGIDFGDLTNARFPFDESTGEYRIETGRSSVILRLTFAQDWNGFKQGDAIPYNVFHPNSYVRNVSVDLGSWRRPKFNVSYDDGPLGALVSGGVKFDGKDLSRLSATVKVRSDLIRFEMESISKKAFEVSDFWLIPIFTTEYDWHIKQRSTPVVVSELPRSLRDGSFQVDWAGSRIHQKMQFMGYTYLETHDEFDNALFTIAEDEAGHGYFEGDYTSLHEAQFAHLV